MRKSTSIFLLLAAAGLVGCPGSTTGHDSGPNPGHDSGTPADDTGVDSGRVGMDSGPVTGTDVPIASVVNGSAADHPQDMTGLVTHVTGDLVALTPRLFQSQSQTSMRCLFAIWVGTAAGGDYSGIEVTETFLPATGNTCFTEPAHMIPDSVAIGDSITNLTGHYLNFCPSGSSCPSFTSEEIDVTNGTFTVGGHGSAPTATMVSIADVTGQPGMPLTAGTRSLALQGALVTLTGVIQTDPPRMGSAPGGNNYVMAVAATGTTTPLMHVRVATYGGVGCQRATLTTLGAGGTVGNVTGVLQYSFGQWVIVVRQSSDLPSVMCSDAGPSAPDAGV